MKFDTDDGTFKIDPTKFHAAIDQLAADARNAKTQYETAKRPDEPAWQDLTHHERVSIMRYGYQAKTASKEPT